MHYDYTHFSLHIHELRPSTIEKPEDVPEYDSILAFSEATTSTFMQHNAAYQKTDARSEQGIMEYDGYVSLPLNKELGSVETSRIVGEEEATTSTFMQPNAVYQKTDARSEQGILIMEYYDGYESLPLNNELGSVDPKAYKIVSEEEPTYESI
jgi:hypothetical protein